VLDSIFLPTSDRQSQQPSHKKFEDIKRGNEKIRKGISEDTKVVIRRYRRGNNKPKG